MKQKQINTVRVNLHEVAAQFDSIYMKQQLIKTVRVNLHQARPVRTVRLNLHGAAAN